MSKLTRVLCWRRVSGAGADGCIPWLLWDAVACPYSWYLLPAHPSSILPEMVCRTSLFRMISDFIASPKGVMNIISLSYFVVLVLFCIIE